MFRLSCVRIVLSTAAVVLGLTNDGVAQGPIRFEAETITQPSDAWQINKHSDNQWNLWSTDQDADKKWSGGVVLQSPRVLKDRQHPGDGAPVLHSVVAGLPPGKYDVRLGGVGRPIGISTDGTTWRKLENSSGALGLFEIDRDGFELWVDDRYASTTNPGSCYYDFLEFTPLPDPNRKPKVNGFAKQRVTEKLDRGVVAMPTEKGKIYVGWRLLKEDSPLTAFNIYRSTSNTDSVKLNSTPITKTTDFVDNAPVSGTENCYTVAAIIDGKEQSKSKPVSVMPTAEAQFCKTIQLQGDYRFLKCGIADLNGDGAYDFVIKQPGGNVDPYEKYWKPSPDTFKIEAYLADGTFLWRHDLGWAIERGIWYSPMIVYDLDGDGKAEVCLKAGEGDPRDADGRVFTGNEYLLVLDGMTGKQKARIDWIPRSDFPEYNLASRNQLGIAFLDGKTPSVLMCRGTYATMQVVALELREGQLQTQWKWSDAEEGGRYRGQGAHSMHALDIDGDGRDEVFLGSSVLDDNGVGLWSTGMGHPDHHYVGDIDPDRPGLEVYYGYETRQSKNGCCMVDAATGEILWGIETPTRHVHSTGMCSDIDPNVPGWECYSSDTDNEKKSERRWLFDARGNLLRDDLDWGFGYDTVYWDADPQRELIRSATIEKYVGGDIYSVGRMGSVIGTADILGDWREEIITSVDGQLRIYTTTIPATDRRICLMQSPLYRTDVALQAMGYTQTPMLGEGETP